MNARFIVYCLLVGVSFVAGPCLAKGITIELTIAGRDFELPVHTTDPVAISAIVWGTNWFESEAGSVVIPDDSLPRMTVYFWVKLPNHDVQMKYVVSYIWQPDDQSAIVCFPGPRDAWYESNIGTITREGIDGNCFRAEETWGQAIKNILP